MQKSGNKECGQRDMSCGISAGLCGDLYCKLWKRKSVRKRCRHESCLAWNHVNYRKEKREKGG